MALRPIILAILVSLFWGLNYIAARVAMDVIPPFLLLLLRFSIIAALLVPFFPRPKIPWRELVALSFLLGTLHFGLSFFALGNGLSVSGTIISGQLGVPFSCLLGSIAFNDRLGRWRSLGMLVAFSGIVLIAGSPQIAAAFGPFLLACMSSLAWATANIVMKRVGQVPILPLLGWISLLCIPQLAVLTLLFDRDHLEILAQAGHTQWLALAYTIIFSTLFAYGTWYWLLGRFPVSQVAPFNLLTPVFGLAAAQWFFVEPITPLFIAGSVLTLIGVAIILIRRPKLAA